jgi:hypothetical protein
VQSVVKKVIEPKMSLGQVEKVGGEAPRADADAPSSRDGSNTAVVADKDEASVSLEDSNDKKKRAKARANGMAFLKADIPALTVQNSKAGDGVVSTELRISPRTLAARKAKEEGALSASKSKTPSKATMPATSEVKTLSDAPTPMFAPVPPRTLAPKQPVDQRTLMESFMIQPDNASTAAASVVELEPLSTQSTSYATPFQIKAFQKSVFAPISAEKSATKRPLPSILQPLASAVEASDVMSRLKRAMEARSRADEENKRQLEISLRQKEEERKRREKEMEARKVKQANEEAREREARRLRQERLAQFRLQEEEAQRKAMMEKSRFEKMLDEQGKLLQAPETSKLNALTMSTKRTSGQVGFTTSTAEAEKRRRLLENAQAAIHGHSQPSANAMRTPTRSIFKTNFASSSSHHRTPVVDSYPISPYCTSDSEEDEERQNKMIPNWARGDALVPQLKAQSYVDPDDIFPNPSLTCSLGKIFKKSTRDRRRSSSNWAHDRLTLQEELSYKQKMGFR